MFEYIFICVIVVLLILYALNKRSKEDAPTPTLTIPDHSNANEVPFQKESMSEMKMSETHSTPNYLIEDETNYAKRELLNLLLKMNQKTIRLKSPCNYTFYNQTTTDDLLRRTLDEISEFVLTQLNKKSSYQFQKSNYGDVHVWCDAKGNKEYKFELFAWSLKHYFQLKFYIHVVKFVKSSEMKPYNISSSPYIFPTYHNGYPCKDQMIPAPHEVIPTGNIVLSTKSVKPNSVEKAEYVYLNNVDLENSTLVINSHIQKDKQFIMDVGDDAGIIDNKLEYTHLHPSHKPQPIQPCARQANRWIETPDKPEYMGQYPCKTPSDVWDEDGIYYQPNPANRKERNYEVCVGTRSSTEPLPLQPNFWVNNYAEAGTGVNCGTNSWLFSNYNGAQGTFVGGGKR